MVTCSVIKYIQLLSLFLAPGYGDWTEEDIDNLRGGLRKWGRAWGKIYREVGGRKTATQCKKFFDSFCHDQSLGLSQALSERSSIQVSNAPIDLTLCLEVYIIYTQMVTSQSVAGLEKVNVMYCLCVSFCRMRRRPRGRQQVVSQPLPPHLCPGRQVGRQRQCLRVFSCSRRARGRGWGSGGRERVRPWRVRQLLRPDQPRSRAARALSLIPVQRTAELSLPTPHCPTRGRDVPLRQQAPPTPTRLAPTKEHSISSSLQLRL